MTDKQTTPPHLPLPARLVALLDSGVWPATHEQALRQNLRPLIPTERVRRFAPEESVIYLERPPFKTVAQEAGEPVKAFWATFGALDQIDPTHSLIVADFGLGSDAPIILDYRDPSRAPRVLRLRWSARGESNQWVQCAADFDQFADLLGLP